MFALTKDDEFKCKMAKVDQYANTHAQVSWDHSTTAVAMDKFMQHLGRSPLIDAVTCTQGRKEITAFI